MDSNDFYCMNALRRVHFDQKKDIPQSRLSGAMKKELDTVDLSSKMPTTRYRGSKRKILPWIYDKIKDLQFETVFDGFGGTCSVSFLCKLMGKEVTTNDILASNYHIAVSIIENNKYTLTEEDIQFLIQNQKVDYPSFIEENFKDIYFLPDENKWLDMVISNIHMLSEIYSKDELNKKQSLAYNALFQSCLSKRPYNLFHRKNLYMRTANVKRTFHNKKTWDKTFDNLFIGFCREISSKIIDNNLPNKAICKNIIDIKNNDYDLVYFDPPYFKPFRYEHVDYYNYYHFLEGIVDYESWSNRINTEKSHKPLINNEKMWEKKDIIDNLDNIFNVFSDSIIVMSYGDPGYPSITDIEQLLGTYKTEVQVFRKEYSYKLNHSVKNGDSSYETLIIAK